jgi:hypothetical protein
MRRAILSLLLASLAATPALAVPCTDTEWLIKAYQDILYRPPTQLELALWLPGGVFGQNIHRQDVAYVIATSFEGSMDKLGGFPQTTAGMIQLIFGRDPKFGEAEALVNKLDFLHGAIEPEALAYVIGGTDAAANEFIAYAAAQNPGIAACGSDAAIANQLFRVYLGRNATGDELNQFTGFLAQKFPLQDVALDVWNVLDLNVGNGTLEIDNRMVINAFQRFLRRPPTPGELLNYSKAIYGFEYEAELWGSVTALDEYCTGVLQESFPGPMTPPANLQQLGGNVSYAGPPPQYSVQQPQPPNQVAEQVQVHSLQQQIVAKNAAIAQLSGNPIVTPPPGSPTPALGIETGTVGLAPQSPADVIAALTSQVGALTAQVGDQQLSIVDLQGQVAQQSQTIDALVGADFDQTVTVDAAMAARQATQDRLQAAGAAASGESASRALAHGYSKFDMGDAALSAGDAGQAMRDYEAAFKDAVRAERLGSR